MPYYHHHRHYFDHRPPLIIDAFDAIFSATPMMPPLLPYYFAWSAAQKEKDEQMPVRYAKMFDARDARRSPCHAPRTPIAATMMTLLPPSFYAFVFSAPCGMFSRRYTPRDFDAHRRGAPTFAVYRRTMRRCRRAILIRPRFAQSLLLS